MQGLECLRKIRPLLSRLRTVGTKRDMAGNRRLFLDQFCALIRISTGESPNRVMMQMVWYSLIGLASLEELEAFIKKYGRNPVPRCGDEGRTGGTPVLR